MSLPIELWLGLLAVGYLIAFKLVGRLAKKWGLAGTAKAYWLIVPLLLLSSGLSFAVLNEAGIIQNGQIAESVKPRTPNAEEFFARLPIAELVLMALAGTVWLIGFNVIVHRQMRKAGRNPWAMFLPFHPGPGALDAKARKSFGVIFLVGLGFMAAALVLHATAPVTPPGGETPVDARGPLSPPAGTEN